MCFYLHMYYWCVCSGCSKLGMSSSSGTVRVVLETDATEVEDEDYFNFLESQTALVLLTDDQQYVPLCMRDAAGLCFCTNASDAVYTNRATKIFEISCINTIFKLTWKYWTVTFLAMFAHVFRWPWWDGLSASWLHRESQTGWVVAGSSTWSHQNRHFFSRESSGRLLVLSHTC